MSEQHAHIDDLLNLPGWDTSNAQHTWQEVPPDLLGEINWWEGQHTQIPQNGYNLDLQGTSGSSSIDVPAQLRPLPDKKRQRTEADEDYNSSETASPSPETLIAARKQLTGCSLQGVDMVSCADLPCDDRNLFTIAPMGPDPLDYFGSSLRTGDFQARVVEPVFGKDLHFWMDMPGAIDQTVRPPGKSLHLVFTQYPVLASHPISEIRGFALLTICRRRIQDPNWKPQCFVSFEDSNSKPPKLSGNKIGFVGNLDRCVGVQNGKRIWGQRTSHVKHSEPRAKPLRIAPRGSTKSYAPDDNFCILISLHDTNGLLMSDRLGEFCIARTNPFKFEEKTTDSSLPHLIGILDKLTFSEKVSLAATAPFRHREITNLVLTGDNDTQEAAGLMSAQLSDQLPSTACPLSAYLSPPGSPPSLAYKNRLQSVARWMGSLHANAALSSKHTNYLKSSNIAAARGRYLSLVDTDINEHQQWLASEGVTLKIDAVSDRAQMLGTIMSERKYKSHWIVCVVNIYPDTVMVDQQDENIVYCLAEEGRESPLQTCDRLNPLARLAFTSKLGRQDVQDILLDSYKVGFEANHKGKEEAIFPERFWLLLHAMRLDLFLYWTKFRDPGSCRRIEASLLEDDEHFDASFFDPGRFKKLKR